MKLRDYVSMILLEEINDKNSNNFISTPVPKDALSVIEDWKRLEVKGVIFDFLKLRDSKKFVIELDGVGEIGSASLNDYDKNFDGVYLDNIRIDPNYRRLGLATYLYKYIEDIVGEKLNPSPIKQSPEIKQFWKKFN